MGDAFALPSRDMRYYIDLALMIPSVIALAVILAVPVEPSTWAWSWRLWIGAWAVLIACFLSAREPLIVLGAGLSYIAAIGGLKGLLLGEWKVLLVAALAFVAFFALIRVRGDGPLRYNELGKLTFFRLLIIGLVLLIASDVLTGNKFSRDFLNGVQYVWNAPANK